MAWSSSHVGWSGRGALNLAAMRTRRSRAVMSLVDGPDFVVYHGELRRRSCRAPGLRPAVAYQGPLRRPALVAGGQFPVRVAVQAPRGHRAGQRDDGRALRLGDPPLAPAPGKVAQPVEAGVVEPVQPAAHLVLMTANPGRDLRDRQPVPAQRDDPGPLDPVRRGMPGAREPADLPGIAVIERRAPLSTSARNSRLQPVSRSSRTIT